MGLLSRFFGKTAPEAKPNVPEITGGAIAADPMIEVFDSFGRKLHISREEWIDKVLIANLEHARSNPDELFGLIAGAVRDGFSAHVVSYAERLQEIDPEVARGATMLGVAYLECNRLADAERVFNNFLARHGDNGYVLTNLAKVYDRRGETAKVDATLWRGMQADPNQENALMWLHARACDEHGAEAGLAVYRQAAAIPNSWLAQLWLARTALEQKQNDVAMALYAEALQAAPRPAPALLLMQMSGDLGKHGLLVEALRLTTPLFFAAVHGIAVGNNLIRANVELGRLDHARALVDQLFALKRPDFEQTLGMWDGEIAKARLEANAQLPPTPLQFETLCVTAPLWLPEDAAFSLGQPIKAEDAVIIAVVSPTIQGGQGEPLKMQQTNLSGRLARSLMLFLTERLCLGCDAEAVAVQWVAVGDGGGFVVVASPWRDAFAANPASPLDPPADYVVLCHFEAASEPYAVELQLVRNIDESLLASRTFPLDSHRPSAAFLEMADWLLAAAAEHAGVQLQKPPDYYRLPAGPQLDDYLLRIEQELALRSAAARGTADSLSREREIIQGHLRLCLVDPANPTTRLMLATALDNLKRIRPNVVEEFDDKIALLQREHPIAPPVGAVIERLLSAGG